MTLSSRGGGGGFGRLRSRLSGEYLRKDINSYFYVYKRGKTKVLSV